jgi:8-amino-7-oxononanoate synthase
VSEKQYAEHLKHLKETGRLRSLNPHGKNDWKLNLSSNDYLGLGKDQTLQQQFFDERGTSNTDDYALAASSSRLLTGDTQIAHQLEADLASAYKSKAALLYNSGYHANIGILPALFAKGDLILSDKLNHASIHDGFRLSRAVCKRYNHCDYRQLRNILKKYRSQFEQVVIVSESVFSMDGDVADINELVRIKEEFDTMLYIDEAHGVGLYGATGLGKVEEMRQLNNIDLLVGTFGKAWASVGAFVCCSQTIRDFLINSSRSLIFTTSLPPLTLAWNRFVFNKSLEMNADRQHLQKIAKKLRDALRENGLPTDGESNIVPIHIGEDAKAMEWGRAMQKQGYLTLPVRPPAVPEGTARFRMSLSADMQWQDLQNLPAIIKGCQP